MTLQEDITALDHRPRQRSPFPEGDSMKREWVVGFLMDEEAQQVVLIRKNRPEWQAGKLNGVGGKVEPGELPANAMQREFYEEAGLSITDWHHFASLAWEEGVVYFYRSFRPRPVLSRAMSMTDEPIEQHTIWALPSSDSVTANLLWLLPLAAHRSDTYDVIDVVELETTLRRVGA